jgi:hypothetical protein
MNEELNTIRREARLLGALLDSEAGVKSEVLTDSQRIDRLFNAARTQAHLLQLLTAIVSDTSTAVDKLEEKRRDFDGRA